MTGGCPYNRCRGRRPRRPVSAALPRWERIAASLRAAKQVPLGYSSQGQGAQGRATLPALAAQERRPLNKQSPVPPCGTGLCLSKNLHGYKYRREGYHRLARANTPDSVSFRRFLLFPPWRAPARLRLKKQKLLENPSLAGAEQFCRSRNVSRQEKTRREYLPYCQGA